MRVLLFHDADGLDDHLVERAKRHHLLRVAGIVDRRCGVGDQFSGKTDELIRRLVRATIAKQKVQVFKPSIDVRYAVEKVTSHAGSDYEARPVQKSSEILACLAKAGEDDFAVISRGRSGRGS